MSKIKDQRSIEQILRDAADVLFPAEEEPPVVTVASADCMGDTALHVYLWRGDDYAARLLILNGANVNAVGEMDETPLHVAVRNASSGTIALLIANGASETVVSEFGQNPPQLARVQGRENAYKEAELIARDLIQAKRWRQGEA
jgi:uncharacterized protein